MAKSDDSKPVPPPAPLPSAKFEGNLVGGTVKGMFEVHNRGLPDAIFRTSGKGQKKSRQELEFSLAMILCEVAGSDQNFEQREMTMVADSMKVIFGTSQQEAYTFINQARGSLQHMRGASKHAEILKSTLNDESLRQIMTSIENLATKDAAPAGFEMYLKDKYAKIFGLIA